MLRTATLVTLVVATTTAAWASARDDALMVRLRALALRHESSAILSLQGRVERTHDPVLGGIWVTALYYSAPARYEREFVASYPWRQNQAVIAVLFGPGFPIAGPTTALSQIARRGDPVAIRKTVLGRAYSDGVIAEGPSDAIQEFARRWPRVTLDALRSVPIDRRDNAIGEGCFAQPQLLKLRPRDALDRHLIALIRTTRDVCP